MKHVLLTNMSDGCLYVTGTADCGTKFFLGFVKEPLSENPVLELATPLGFQGVRQIIVAAELWRDAHDGSNTATCGI